MSNLLSVYKAMLDLGPFKVNRKGKISLEISGVEVPFTIGNKDVYLPSPWVLKKGRSNKVELFHPLHENIMVGPPASIIAYRNIMVQMINQIHMKNFIESLATDEEGMSKDLIATRSVIKSNYPPFTGTDKSHIMKILDANDCIEIKLEHGKMTGDVVAVITSPLLDEIYLTLDDADNGYFIGDIKATKKSLNTLKNILRDFLGFKDSREASEKRVVATGTMAKSTEAITSAIGILIMALEKSFKGLKGEDYKAVKSTRFYEYEIFANKSTLSRLVKTVNTNSAVAKKKKKRKKKKVQKDVLEPVFPNTAVPQQPYVDPNIDDELAGLASVGGLIGNQVIPPAPNPYGSYPHQQNNNPYQGQPQQPAPTYGRFGWR